MKIEISENEARRLIAGLKDFLNNIDHIHPRLRCCLSETIEKLIEGES